MRNLLLILLLSFVSSYAFSQGLPKKNTLDGTEKLRLFSEPTGNKYIDVLGIGTYTLDSLLGGGITGAGITNRVAYWTGADTIAADADFFFNGTNVGIGTASPVNKLSVNGNIDFDPTSATLTRLWGDTGDGVGKYETVSSVVSGAISQPTNQIVFGTGSGVSSNSYLTQNGLTLQNYIQLGTTSIGNGGVLGIKYDRDGGPAGGDYSTYWAFDAYFDGSDDTWKALRTTLGNKWLQKMGYHDNAITWSYSVSGDPVSWSELMRLNSNGNVGIGTANPQATANYKTLQVNGTLGSQILLGTGSSGYNSFIYNDTFNLTSIGSIGALRFLTNDTPVERMRILENGNVGIGTYIPQNKLDVEGGVAIGEPYSGTSIAPTNGAIIHGDVGIGTNNPFGKLMVVNNDGNQEAARFYGTTGQTADIFKILNSSAQILFNVDTIGRVGLGNSAPQNKLSVNGNIDFDPVSGTLTRFWGDTGDGVGKFQAVGDVVSAAISQPASQIVYGTGGGVSSSAKILLFDPSSNQPILRLYGGDGADGSGPAIQMYKDGAVHGFFGLETGGFGGTGGGMINFVYGNRPYHIATNAVRRLTVLGDGNVGIGTSSPSYKLDVSGSFRVNATSDFLVDLNGYVYHGNNYWQYVSGNNYFLGTRSLASGDINIITDDVVRINVEHTSGNVGIGTTSPQSKLDVVGVITSRVSSFVRHDFDGSSNQLKIIANAGIGNISDSDIIFQNSVSGGALQEKMRIAASGNVGIGTDSPQNKLDVEGKVAIGSTYSGTSVAPDDGLIVEGNVGIGTTSVTSGMKMEVAGDMRFGSSSGLYTYSNTINAQYDTDSDAASFGLNYFGYQGGTTRYRDFFIADGKTNQILKVDGSAGYVGIGITSPSQKLDVSDTGANNPTIKVGETTNGSFTLLQTGTSIGSRIVLNDAVGGERWDINNGGIVAGKLIFEDNNSTDRLLTLSNDSRVGIGTTSPTQKLHVEGTARITGSDGTPTRLLGNDTDGDVSFVTLGDNVSLSNDTLNVNVTASIVNWEMLDSISTDTLTFDETYMHTYAVVEDTLAGNKTLRLPTPTSSTKNWRVTIKATARTSGSILISVVGGGLLDGYSGQQSISAAYSSRTYANNGTTWYYIE